jgi:hypothetical protein
VLQQVSVSLTRTERIPGTTAPLAVRYLLIDPGNANPAPPPAGDGFEPLERVAVLVLFIGGDGTLDIRASPLQLNTGSPNFLARNRNHFAAEGFVVAVVDAATDFNQHNHALVTNPDGSVHGGGLRGHRLPGRLHGEKHLSDLRDVMNDLRRRYPALPIWAVGTSRGTVSAAITALPVIPGFDAVNPPADGLVLTSSLTGPDASEDMHGVDDACRLTRPQDSDALRARFRSSSRVHVHHVSGGSTPIDDPCDALAPHGFFGIDQKVIEVITKWIRHREH